VSVVPAVPAPPVPAAATGSRGPAVVDRGVVRHDRIDAVRWSTRGTVKVVGDVVADEVVLAGVATVGGGLRASRLDLRGQLQVHGPVEISAALTGGQELLATAGVRAGTVDFRGTLGIRGAFTVGGHATLVGRIHLTTASVGIGRLEGVVEIGDRIEGQRVDAVLRTGSRIGAIVAKELDVRGPVRSVVDRAFGRTPEASIDRIEGDRVSITGVDVAVVRAPEVRIGPGCHVVAVEGRIVAAHPSSRVGPQSRSPPPYGLRR